MQKLLTFFFSKNISIYAIFNDQSFNDLLTNDIVSFEQLGPDEFYQAAEPGSIIISTTHSSFSGGIYHSHIYWQGPE